MAKKEKKQSFVQRLKHKYRLSIYRDETFEEVVNYKLSRLNVFALLGSFLFIFMAIIVVIIAYTPVREFIPGYPDAHTRRHMVMNEKRQDTLELELQKRDQYFENIKRIIAGEEPESYENVTNTEVNYDNIEFTRSVEDSLIREIFESDDQFNLSLLDNNSKVSGISQLHFFPPVKGIVTNSFNSGMNHYGTDVVSRANEVVKSTLEGTVMMATWTLETGWVIQVQHDNNIISIYKHNAELLKKVGDHVNVGEPIAIIGNSGELTTGPHLHFELWYNGVPLDPEDYISF